LKVREVVFPVTGRRWRDEDTERDRERRTLAAMRKLSESLAGAGVPRDTTAEDSERKARQELVLANTGVATAIALRYRGRGEATEELVQTAYLGLVKAANGYDPTRGRDFLVYAIPTITGEVKRHFRDRTWDIRVPRRLQELKLDINDATATLAQKLGRSPTVAEIAQAIGASEEETLEAIELGNAYDTVSLDSRMTTESESAPMTLAEFVGGEDETLATLQQYGDLAAAIESLEEREKVIINLRFFKDLSQAEVAKRLNISQMHVSRLQHRALGRLREILEQEREQGERQQPEPEPLRRAA
jgi:RNA polymerase sigma-B factor